MTPKQTVEAVFAAFTRGDVPAILGKVSPNCQWSQSKTLPWGGVHTGPEGVGQFFSRLDAACATTLFEVDEIYETGENVFAFGRHGAEGRKSGRATTSDWAFHFKVRDGKVTLYVGYNDTAAINTILG